MARIIHVKSARQRFEMVPDVDDLGNQKESLVRNPDGSPKTTKHGEKVYRRLTVQDRSKPLPNLRCDLPECGEEILPGQPYKHITPYDGEQHSRHAEHRDWHVWEYSNSRSAQIMRTQSEMHDALDAWQPTDEGDFESMREELEGMAQTEADDQEAALSAMPEGLQDGSQAAETLDLLEGWLDEISGADASNEDFYERCTGCNPGDVCSMCNDTGFTKEVSERWELEARDTLSTAIDAFEG